ncbi:MAG: SDR family oxidoreductase [Caldilineaceae bacterium]
MKLDGKTAIITGGGTGIGAGIARLFAQEGAQVVICGRRREVLEQSAATCKGAHPVRVFAIDITKLDQVQEMIGAISKEIGPIDILVNNAGTNVRQRKMSELQPDGWQTIIDANMTGVYNLIYSVLPQMRERKDGVIITVSSTAAVRPNSLGGGAYSASKQGINAMMKVLSDEEGENGIRATIINPGEVNTPLLDGRPVPPSAEHKERILQPSDLAAAALFVATQPARVHIGEITLKPIAQKW